MAGDRRLDRAPLLAAAGVTAVGLAVGGAGFLNGDAAAYAAQGLAGDLASRPVHAAYVAVAVALGGLGDALPRALDALTAVAAGGAVLAATHAARAPALAAAVAAACVLPWCAFAEVDLPWMALVLAAVVAPPAAAAAAAGLAVAVSPTALLAMPWVAVERGGARVLAGPWIAVAVLTLASGGAWWTGDRGVLTGALLPGRSLEVHLLSGLWALALLPRRRAALALLPLVLAPPDVPTWLLWGLASARHLPRVRWARGLALGTVLLGLWGLGERRAHVAREDRVLRAVAEALRPGDAVEAPWSWGARLGVIASGDPYGVHWVAVPQPVRDQVLCPAERVLALPPGAWPSTGVLGWEGEVAYGAGCSAGGG